METLSIDGKKFVKASKIAQDYGYTSDYIGQLCRGGKVTAKLVGRSWYVAVDSLDAHRANRYKKIEAESKEPKKGYAVTIHSTPVSAAHKSSLLPESNGATVKKASAPLSFVSKRFYDRIPKYAQPVSYNHDESELIPAAEAPRPHLEKPKEISISLADAESVSIKAEPAKYTFKTTERPTLQFTGELAVAALPEEDPLELPPQHAPVAPKVMVTAGAHESPEPPPIVHTAVTAKAKASPVVVHVIKQPVDPIPKPVHPESGAYIIPTRRADAGTGEIKDVTITRNQASASSTFHRAVLTVATVGAVAVVAVLLGFQSEIVSTGKHTAEAISFSVDELKAAVYGSK